MWGTAPRTTSFERASSPNELCQPGRLVNGRFHSLTLLLLLYPTRRIPAVHGYAEYPASALLLGDAKAARNTKIESSSQTPFCIQRVAGSV